MKKSAPARNARPDPRTWGPQVVPSGPRGPKGPQGGPPGVPPIIPLFPGLGVPYYGFPRVPYDVPIVLTVLLHRMDAMRPYGFPSAGPGSPLWFPLFPLKDPIG